MRRSTLKRLWRELYDNDPPRHNRRTQENRLAYRLQELAFGGLKAATVKRLETLAAPQDVRRTRGRRTDRRPLAGTKLMREWQGVTYEVIVQPDHFEFQGRHYKSLSAVARAITGTVWNGWTFFGLKNPGSKQ